MISGVPSHRGSALASTCSWALIAICFALVVWNAWVCDDAFITLRTVDNLVHNRGLTWNPGERVQVILLDTRYHRDALQRRVKAEGEYGGPYGTSSGTILGEEQWEWLAQQLTVEADLRIICTSIQFVAEEHHWLP